MSTHHVAAAAIAWTLLLGVPSAALADEASAAARVAKALGFAEADREKLMDGKLVTHQLREEAAKELAVTVALKIPLPVEDVFAAIRARDFAAADRTILASGAFGGERATASDLAGLELPAKELARLVKAKPGSDLNLSAEEVAAIAEAAKAPAAERDAAVMQRYRELLADRVNAYRAKGLDGIAPYTRGRKESNPAADLRGAIPPKDALLAELAPSFYRALAEYPAGGGGTEHDFLWMLQNINDRPAVVLAHRIVGQDHRNAFLSHRDFYVSQGFDALQILVGCLPLAGETVAFYTNATYTEQVAGFGSSAAHGIGRRIMTGEVEELLTSIRAAAEAS